MNLRFFKPLSHSAAILLWLTGAPQLSADTTPSNASDQTNPAPEDSAKVLAALPKPANELEHNALAALDKHCARCHQNGKLEGRRKPASGFGNILNLQEVARDSNFVVPGNPDNSELVKQIASGNMPYDIKDGSNIFAPTPSDEEVAAIRQWIISLAGSQDLACKGRDFTTNQQLANAISEDMEKLPDHRIKNTRYITLTHLANSCADTEALETYRQAVVKLLNSLSTNSDVLQLSNTKVDDAGTIIRFNLDDLNWTADNWESLVAVYPYTIKPDGNRFDFMSARLGTAMPYLRGDWLAFTAARPPVYHDLLKLPADFAALTKQLDVDVETNIEKFLVRRAGFQRSFVSQNNRLIERHSISTGYFWTSYDFAGNKGNQSLFEHPLGPNGDNPFKHDGGETIFSLPNGFNGYYLNAASGARLDKGPTEIVRDVDRKDLAVTNGISCFGCHDQGIRLAKDDIRGHVVNDRNFSKKVRETVEAIYPPHKEMDKILKDDTARFQNAMKAAGLDPTLKLGGIEPISALSNQYEKNLDMRQVAAEFGLKPDQLASAAGDVGGDARTLVRRLEQQGYVPRDNLEGTFAGLVSKLTDDETVAVAAAQASPAKVAKVGSGDNKVEGSGALTLLADKTNYSVNDLPVFTVKSDADCYLTLINIDGKGTGTVLFPNKFQQANLLKANKEFIFPGDEAPFQFRMKDPGTEKVIALCNPNGVREQTIAHNFASNAFTNLGNYEQYATRAIVVEAKKVKEKAKKNITLAAVEKIAKRSGINRTAIKIEVKP
jgi:hypothetical protein